MVQADTETVADKLAKDAGFKAALTTAFNKNYHQVGEKVISDDADDVLSSAATKYVTEHSSDYTGDVALTADTNGIDKNGNLPLTVKLGSDTATEKITLVLSDKLVNAATVKAAWLNAVNLTDKATLDGVTVNDGDSVATDAQNKAKEAVEKILANGEKDGDNLSVAKGLESVIADYELEDGYEYDGITAEYDEMNEKCKVVVSLVSKNTTATDDTAEITLYVPVKVSENTSGNVTVTDVKNEGEVSKLVIDGDNVTKKELKDVTTEDLSIIVTGTKDGKKVTYKFSKDTSGKTTLDTLSDWVEEKENSIKLSDFFTMTNNFKSEVGSYETVLTLNQDKKTTVKLPFDVVTAKNVTATNFSIDTSKTTLKKVTASDASVTVGDVDASGNAKVTATKAGDFVLTATDANGLTYEAALKVKENGKMLVAPIEKAGTATIPNTADTLGLVVKDNADITVTEGELSVAKAEVATENGKSVLKITTNAFVGSAKLLLKGGRDKKIETEVTFDVDSDGKITNIVVNKKKAVTEVYIEDGKLKDKLLAAKDKYKKDCDVVSIAGLTSDDTLRVTVNGEYDYVPATDATYKVEVEDATDDDGIVTGGGAKITITYAGESCDFTTSKGELSIVNNTKALGLVGTSVKVIVGGEKDDQNVSKVASASIENGKVVVRALQDNGTCTVVVTDADGNKATIDCEVVNGEVKVTETSGNKNINKFEVHYVTILNQPSKKVYFIGDELKLDDSEFAYYLAEDWKDDNSGPKPDARLIKGKIKPEMLYWAESGQVNDQTPSGAKATTAKSTNGKKSIYFYFAQHGQSSEAEYEVKAREKVLANTDLGLAANETITAVTYPGTNEIKIESINADKNIRITASEISKKEQATITTSKGTKLTLNVTVDEKGQISYTYFAYGKTVDVKNDADTLGLVAETVLVDGDAVKAEFANLNGVIRLSAVKAGNATVTAVDKDGNKAVINVTVDAKGNVVVNSIDRYETPLENEPGWHDAENGGWYYVDEKGTILKNTWFEENGKRYYLGSDGVTLYRDWTNKIPGEVGTWYYFDKWGVAIKNGWKWIDNTCYFFEDYKMVRDAWIVDENGVKEGYVKYWGGAAANQWLKLDGSWYHFDKYAAVSKNKWVKSNNKWCFLAKDGVMAANKWVSWKGKYYYVDKNGYMLTNTYVGKYYVDKNGVWDKSKDKK